MTMDLNDKPKSEVRRLFRSFSNAINGLIYIVKKERNMQIHLCLSLLVLSMSVILGIKKQEMIVVLLLIGLVVCLEFVNSAVERTVDLITTDYHPLAKIAKDAAAAAVLVAAIISAIIGMIIFFDPLISLLNRLL
jgi:diacylglycerol kinase